MWVKIQVKEEKHPRDVGFASVSTTDFKYVIDPFCTGVTPLLSKQAGINQPNGSKNRPFLGPTIYVSMKYLPDSIPRIAS